MNRNTITAVAFLVMFVGLGAAYLYLSRDVAAAARSAPLAPAFEVDPLWPKPLPNHWVLGSTSKAGASGALRAAAATSRERYR